MTAVLAAGAPLEHHIGGHGVPSRQGPVPFGGTKLSGTGRERGLVALDSYTRSKTVVARVCSSPEGSP